LIWSAAASGIPRDAAFEGIRNFRLLCPSESAKIKVMKKTFSCLLLLSVCILASCLSSPKNAELSDRDPISSFFDRESLTITEFEDKTNDCGYNFNFFLTYKNDTNRVFLGWMMISDVEKEKKKEAQRDLARKEAEEKLGREIVFGTNEFVNIGTLGKEGRGKISEARPLKSERITKRFPGCHIFSVTCLEASGNPLYIAQPLVITTNKKPAYFSNIFILKNAATVTTLINLYKQPVRNRDEARETLDLLCELQSWTLCESTPPVHVKQRKDAVKDEWLSRWRYTETATSTGWNFKAVFLTDPQIKSYTYCEVDVLHDGTITIKDQQCMGQSGGYL